MLSVCLCLLEFLCSNNISYCDPLDNNFGYGDYIEQENRDVSELDGRPINYEPYRPGLQPTNEGYRYELDGSSHRPLVRSNRNEGIHGPSAYQSSYESNYYNQGSNSGARVRVEDYYGISNDQSVRNGVCINPIDSEYYRESYVTNPLHDETYPAAGESIINKTKKKINKFVNYVKKDIRKEQRIAQEIQREKDKKYYE